MSKIALAKEETKLETLKETLVEDVRESKPVKKKMTKEEYKEKFRKMDVQYTGRLHVDEKYKNPDKVLRIDNDDPATRKYLAELGYTPVTRIEGAANGSGSLNEASNLDSYVRFEQSIAGQSQPGILYEIDKDLYDARKEVEVEQNNELLQSKVEEMQREDQLGKKFK
jgi:hypothetical protein